MQLLTAFSLFSTVSAEFASISTVLQVPGGTRVSQNLMNTLCKSPQAIE